MEDDRVDAQPVLIHQAVQHQRRREVGASHDEGNAARLLLELVFDVRDVVSISSSWWSCLV